MAAILAAVVLAVAPVAEGESSAADRIVDFEGVATTGFSNEGKERLVPQNASMIDAAVLVSRPLRRLCRESGLIAPQILNARMRRPGNDGGLPQSVRIDASYVAMPEECEDRFRRTGSFLVQIKDKSRKRWRNMTVTGQRTWEGIQVSAEGGPAQIIVGPSGHGPSAKGQSWFYNKNCRPVRAFLKNRVLKDAPKKVWIKRRGQSGFWGTRYPVVGQTIKKVRVTLGGHCARR